MVGGGKDTKRHRLRIHDNKNTPADSLSSFFHELANKIVRNDISDLQEIETHTSCEMLLVTQRESSSRTESVSLTLELFSRARLDHREIKQLTFLDLEAGKYCRSIYERSCKIMRPRGP